MLRSETFWSEENGAPLLKLNYGYLQQIGDASFERTSKWLAAAGADGSNTVVLAEVAKPDRMLVADAERTFRDDVNRKNFVKLLSHVVSSFGDYAQGLSFVASFLRLTMNESDVIAILTKLNATEKYLPGYWKTEAIKFTTDSLVFQHLLNKYYPELYQHLQKNGVDASVYCQKFFVGLCVHVLPFEYLFPYFEGFFEGGYQFIMKFALSLCHQLEPQILAVHNDPGKIFGLLRLDPKNIPHNKEFNTFLDKVFAGVKDYDFEGIDFKSLREQMYEKHLKARVEGAHAQQNKAKEDNDDGIEDCEICLDDFPEVLCKTCNLKICENCHNNPPAKSSHKSSHKVTPIDDEDTEEEEEEEGEDKEGKEEGEASDSLDKVTNDIAKLSVKN